MTVAERVPVPDSVKVEFVTVRSVTVGMVPELVTLTALKLKVADPGVKVPPLLTVRVPLIVPLPVRAPPEAIVRDLASGMTYFEPSLIVMLS